MAWTLPISVLSSEFTTPAWLVFGARLESLLRCTHCERLSLKHEVVNNVSVDISPGDSPSLRDALVENEAEGNVERRMICLARVGKWLALVRRNCQPSGAGHGKKGPNHRRLDPSVFRVAQRRHAWELRAAECHCIRETSEKVDTTHVLAAMARLGITSTIRQCGRSAPGPCWRRRRTC